MNRKVVVKRLNKKEVGREIVISDIHGNLSLYQRLLQKIDYKKGEDRLILLGDLVEKGPQNLQLVRFVMQQVESEDVHCITGNCDFVAKNIVYNYRLPFLKSVLSVRKNSLIHEMASEIGIEMDRMDMDEFAYALRKAFLKELSFLNDLPHVIETETTIYAHAAIENEETFGDDFREVMASPFFFTRPVSFHKKVVVGHIPVSEYCDSIARFDPLFDGTKNIYSIDGGNMVKSAGQLNALIFEKDHCMSVHIEDQPVYRVVRDVNPSIQIPFYINFNQGKIDVLEEQEQQALVYSEHHHRQFWIDRAFVQTFGNDLKGTDYTNYHMPLKKGEHVHVVFTYSNKAQVKKNGILGWAFLEDLEPV